ncbi:MAG: hypothetical protein JRF56_23300 [Deltaproteobacteria bacterium]|jgi:hypothetical protein|nr:hypothetical protein [Deltaproteobacteria bacterium]
MKILSALLTALIVLSLSISVAASYIVNLKVLIPHDDHALMTEITYYFNSEPAIMLFIGTCLLGVAARGRKILSDRNTTNDVQRKLKPVLFPYPDPVPWKQED